MAWNDQRIKKRFSFECPMQWQDMDATDDDKIRYCQQCNKQVAEVSSQDEFEAYAKRGTCVSVPMHNGECVVSAPTPADPENDDARTSPRTSGKPLRPDKGIDPSIHRVTGPARPAWIGLVLPLLLLVSIAIALYFFFR